jgi:hypothetical protein
MGLCERLLPLLALQSSKNQVITQGSLRGLVFLSTDPDFYYFVKQNAETLVLIDTFLRGRRHDQCLMACVVCNMFRQLPAHQTLLLADPSLIELLTKCLTSKYASIVTDALNVLDELSYHGENVGLMLGHDALLNVVEDYVQSEIPQVQMPAMHVLLNCLSFIDTYSFVRSVLLKRSFRLELILKQVSQ